MFDKEEDFIKSSDLTLTVTWNPRGEMARFEREIPSIKEVYSHMVISFPTFTDRRVTDLFSTGILSADPFFHIVINEEWSQGRYMAIKLALDSPADHIQYADMDRLLRWMETFPDEWRETAQAIKNFDCFIMGRTLNAYSSHPRALRETEALSNWVVSYILGREMDVSAGSKGFSRRAAQYIVDHCSPGHALGTDSEWPIILSRAGFDIEYITVDGLSWESADRYQDSAVNTSEQSQAAADYDANPNNWIYRVEVAREIVQSALLAWNQPL